MTVKKTNGGMNLFTTVKAINTAIEDIKVRGVSFQIDLHVLACSVLQHVGKHKDTRVLTAFLAAVPDVVRINSLKQWFDKFGCVTFLDADGKPMKEPAYVASKATKIGDAMEKPFWKFKANEGVPYKPLVMDKYCEDQIKKLQKDQKETGTNHSALIQALKLYQPAAVPLPN